jgi:hypothetical protein
VKIYNGFESDEDIENKFQLPSGFLKVSKLKTVYASYDDQCYSGEAFLVFIKTDTLELFEVNASHCSCYGLEGSFQLEPTVLDSIKLRGQVDDATITFVAMQILLENKPKRKRKVKNE